MDNLTFLVVAYFELITLGIVLTMPKLTHRIIYEIKLGFDIVCCFFLWASQGGHNSYTITSEYDGKIREIHIG